MKDTNFYNKESAAYSAKRYPARATTFTQFFFKERLRLTLQLLANYLPADPVSILEIGCADGVVARAIYQALPNRFMKFDAIDLSPQMIEVAKQNNTDMPIRFSVRSEASLAPAYDLVIEIGVLNYTDLEADLVEVSKRLDKNGQYLCSLAGNSSIEQQLKADTGYLHLRSYYDYEQVLQKHFTIVHTIPVGYFIPLLWKLPVIARVLQPVFESIGQNFFPNLAHEKLYVLARKNDA